MKNFKPLVLIILFSVSSTLFVSLSAIAEGVEPLTIKDAKKKCKDEGKTGEDLKKCIEEKIKSAEK